MPQYSYRNPAYGKSVANIAEALFGNPQEAGQMALREAQQRQADAAAGLSGARTEEQEDLNLARRGWGNIIGGFGNVPPEQRALITHGLGADKTGADISNISRMLGFLDPSVTEEAGRRFHGGAGTILPSSYAATALGAEAIATEEQANAMALQAAKDEAAMARARLPSAGKQYKVTGENIEDIPYYAVLNLPGAIKTNDEGESSVNPDVFAGISPEVMDNAMNVSTLILQQTGNMQKAAKSFSDIITKGAVFEEPKRSWWGDVGEPEIPAQFVPKAPAPTVASQPTVPDLGRAVMPEVQSYKRKWGLE